MEINLDVVFRMCMNLFRTPDNLTKKKIPISFNGGSQDSISISRANLSYISIHNSSMVKCLLILGEKV